MPPQGHWKEVGDVLADRRVQLDHRWANRTAFCRDQQIHPRVAYDVEKGARSNYTAPVRRIIELAYCLDRGSLLDAGENGAARLTPAPGSPPVEHSPVRRALRALADDMRDAESEPGADGQSSDA